MNRRGIGHAEGAFDVGHLDARSVVEVLEELVSNHPLGEHLRGQRILGLYRSGRQSEALEQYRQTRSVLVDRVSSVLG